jgi:outer membrane protein assembly factor BamB
VRFRHREDSLIRDFSPGPDGEIYLVNGDRELVRLSSDGSREWTFTPSCVQCTVAGAPTVTDDMIYFPVWQGSPANEGCGDPDPNVVEPDVEATDPLYALTRDGDLKWSYDGFTTLAERYQGGGGAMGMLGLSFSPRVHHHPSGRPIIADDGTLYVPADGAIVALDADGTELGYAVMNPQSGEQRTGDGTMGSRNTPGFSAAPTLAEDGKLYVYDGAQVRAFETRKKPAQIPWTAPFGGNRNASRLSR